MKIRSTSCVSKTKPLLLLNIEACRRSRRNEITSSALETIAPADWYGVTVEGLRLYLPWTLRTKKDEGRGVPLESSGWRGLFFASVDLREWLRDRLAGNASMIGCRFSEGGLGGSIHDLLTDTGTFLPQTADHPDAMLRGKLLKCGIRDGLDH